MGSGMENLNQKLLGGKLNLGKHKRKNYWGGVLENLKENVREGGGVIWVLENKK